MIKKYSSSFTLGVTIGLVVSIIFQSNSGSNGYFPTNPTTFVGQWLTQQSITVAMFYSLVMWGLIGMLSQKLAEIFENENRSVLMNTVIHFVGQLLLITLSVVACGWFDFKWRMFFSFFILFFLIYSVIWGINYLHVKKEIEQINQKL